MKRLSLLIPAIAAVPAIAGAQQLRLIQFASDTSAYNVGSTLVVGRTEAVLVDAQYHWSDAQRVAASIAALRTHLKAVLITHPDEDHYLGAAAIVERFPGTPVYMTPAAIDEFRRTSGRYLAYVKKSAPMEAPDSLVTPTPLTDTVLTVDGVPLEIVRDQQGDVLRPTNSFVWIPSLRTVLAGDIVFNHVHPWLAASTVESRQRWRQALQRIEALHPTAVVAAHKNSPATADTPDVVDAMRRYLDDFDAARRTTSGPEALRAIMREKYPGWSIPVLLDYSARAAFQKTGN